METNAMLTLSVLIGSGVSASALTHYYVRLEHESLDAEEFTSEMQIAEAAQGKSVN